MRIPKETEKHERNKTQNVRPVPGGCCRGQRASPRGYSHAPRALWGSSWWTGHSWSQWTCVSTAPSVGWGWNGKRCRTGPHLEEAEGHAGDGSEFLSEHSRGNRQVSELLYCLFTLGTGSVAEKVHFIWATFRRHFLWSRTHTLKEAAVLVLRLHHLNGVVLQVEVDLTLPESVRLISRLGHSFPTVSLKTQRLEEEKGEIWEWDSTNDGFF